MIAAALAAISIAGCGRVGFGGDAGTVITDGSVRDDGAPLGAYVAAVLADAPRAYFRFEETSGPTAASVVGGVTGTYEGNFQFGQPGAIAGSASVRFDGMTTRIPVGDVFPFGGNAPYTIELWIKAVDIDNTRFVVDRRTIAQPTNGYTFYLGTSYFLAARQVEGTEVGYVNAGALPLNVWTHAALTFDGSRHRLYMNGVEDQVSNATAAMAIGAGPGTFTIGDVDPPQFRKLDAWLDELAVYDIALSADRVAAHYGAAE